MSERNKGEFETSIERKNIRVTAQLGEKAVIFDYLNSTLFEFPETFSHMNHVYHKVNKKGTYYFVDQFGELYETLDKNDFPRMRQPFPSETDERVYGEYFDKRLGQQLDAMGDE